MQGCLEERSYFNGEQCRDILNALCRTGAKVKFLSIELLIGHLTRLDLAGIDWVIVGGESGPGARPMKEKWVRDIRDQCLEQDVAFFFKQWGGVQKSRAGRELDGQTWNNFPREMTPIQMQAPSLSAAQL